MPLSAVWSQFCVKSGISFSRSIPRLTNGDKELVPPSQFLHKKGRCSGDASYSRNGLLQQIGAIFVKG